MSQNLLERIGRGVTSTVTGAAAPNSAVDQQARGHQMIQNLGLGGTMLGGGTAAVVAAIGLLSALKKEKEMEDDARLDDDTLYISDPKKAVQEKSAAAESGVHPLLAPGLAMTSGIVGAGAGYALVQGIYNALEKRRRLALLDAAQQEAVAASDQEAVKAAAAANPKINLMDVLTASPVALPLLTMLATGGVTYAALDKSFPVVGRPKRRGPRRIRVGPDAKPYDVPEDEEMDEPVKEASFQSADLQDAGDEFLASFVAASRKDTLIGDMICKAASGELEAMEHMLKTAGIDSLILSLKGASDRDIPQDKRMLGTMALFKSAALKDTARAIAAAEYLETYGDTFSEISGCPRTMQKMASLGCLFGIISRDSALPELAKQAATAAQPTSPGLLELLKSLLTGGGQQAPGQPMQQPASGSQQQKEDRDAALTSDAGGGLGGIAEEGADGKRDTSESTGNDDVIDSVLAAGDPATVLPPSD